MLFDAKSNTASAEPYDEAQLLSQIKYCSDEQAFERLFHHYYPWLCRQAMTYTACPHRAEEVVLDVFGKLWRGRRDLRTDCHLKAYLFIAVRNQALDYFRKWKRERRLQGELPSEHASTYATPEDIVVGEEFSHAVEAAIESLPPQGRTIFRLSRDANLKYREIADHLGISIKTVETHMRRAFIHLRGHLHLWLCEQNNSQL